MTDRNVRAPFKAVKMHMICCSCGDVMEDHQGAVRVFHDFVRAKEFAMTLPMGNDEHAPAVIEVSLMIPSSMK